MKFSRLVIVAVQGVVAISFALGVVSLAGVFRRCPGIQCSDAKYALAFYATLTAACLVALFVSKRKGS